MNEAEPTSESGDLAASFTFLAETRSCLASPELRRSLRTTRTWVLTLAVVACGWLGIVGVLVIGTTLLSPTGISIHMLGFALVMTFILAVLGLPVFLMFRFAAHIRRFIYTANLSDFVAVLQSQRWMWNILGIYGILAIVVNLAALGLMALAFFR